MCCSRRGPASILLYKTHFRITNLPRPEVIADVFGRMEELLDSYASETDAVARPSPELKVVTK